MRRTVLYFTDSAGFGGAEQVLLATAKGLDRNRWRPVLAYHPDPGIAPLIEEARRAHVELQPVPKMPEGVEGAMRVPAFLRRLRSLRPDVFHAHLTWPRACKFALVGAVLARIPAVVATAHLFVDLPVSRSISLQQRLLAVGVDRYIAVSHALAQRLQTTYGIPAAKLQVVPNGIPINTFNAEPDATLRTTLAHEIARPLVLTVARLDEQKGHRYLLEAAVYVPDATFVFAGDGPERPALEDRARRLGVGDRVVFLGRRDDVPDLLACADLFVLPSLFEGLPLSVLEAMAAGTPVVASAVGGVEEAILHGETGLVVPPAEPKVLAAAIRIVLDHPALAHRLASAGRARVCREFSAKTMVRSVTDIYEELLNGEEMYRGRC